MSSSPLFSSPAPASPALRSFEAQWLARESDALTELRADAMQRFLRLGLPTLRDESWHYTNLRRMASRSFAAAPRAPGGGASRSVLPSLLDGGEDAATVLVLNGHPTLPTATEAWPDSIEISSLKDLSTVDPEIISAHLRPLSDADHARWGLLNAALFEDGLYVRITAATLTPLVIQHVLTAANPDSVAYPRVIIDVAPGCSATVIEHYVEQGAHTPLCNSATHISLERGARVEHYRVFATGHAADHIDTLQVRQGADSRCQQFTIALGGALVRCSLESELDRPGASLDAYSLLIGHGSRHVDCVNIASHNAPRTHSRQTARAIASGTSRVVFNSKVVVNSGAVHAESQQSCRGLLLSPTAEIDSRPQLEIHADEVKCAHGATTGRLDPNMLFYMLSRGLDRETAQSLLVYAFLADVLTDMSVGSARSAIENALIAQLPDSHILQKFR